MTYMSSSSFCIFFGKKFHLILCLNVFGLFDDFKSDGSIDVGIVPVPPKILQ